MSAEIRVSVKPEYLVAQSQPDKDKYTFAYHVTIANTGSEAAKLISRHWIITDGNGTRREVKGLGVIGEQPVIKPGANYHYSSYAVLDTLVGTMEGSYQMEAMDKSQFTAPIKAFLLAVPGIVN
jgi:ApaG protein